MKLTEKGFTVLEIMTITVVAVLIIGAAATVTFRVMQDTQQTNDRITTVHHADSAAYWISRDAQMAGSLTTENLTSPAILTLDWADWVFNGDSIHHTVTYSIEDITEGIGRLKRTHQDSNGTNEQIFVAENIYYNTGDPANTTWISYQSPVLDLKIVTSFGEALTIRELEICRRINF